MFKKHLLKRFAAAAVVASFMFAAAPVGYTGAGAKEAVKQEVSAKEPFEFTKAVCTVTLAGGKGLFDLMATPVHDWMVDISLKITVKSSIDASAGIMAYIGELGGMQVSDPYKTAVTVPADGKASFTVTIRKPLEFITDGISEKQALALLNGKSVKIRPDRIVAYAEAQVEKPARSGYDVIDAGTYILTVQGKAVDSLRRGGLEGLEDFAGSGD